MGHWGSQGNTSEADLPNLSNNIVSIEEGCYMTSADDRSVAVGAVLCEDNTCGKEEECAGEEKHCEYGMIES